MNLNVAILVEDAIEEDWDSIRGLLANRSKVSRVELKDLRQSLNLLSSLITAEIWERLNEYEENR